MDWTETERLQLCCALAHSLISSTHDAQYTQREHLITYLIHLLRPHQKVPLSLTSQCVLQLAQHAIKYSGLYFSLKDLGNSSQKYLKWAEPYYADRLKEATLEAPKPESESCLDELENIHPDKRFKR